MTNQNFFVFILCLAFFISCKQNSDSDTIFSSYQTFSNSSIIKLNKLVDTVKLNKQSTVYLKYYSDGKLKEIKTALVGHIFGHYFIFNEDGSLKNYFFLNDSINAKLLIQSGSEIGSAYVDYLPNETNDTLKNILYYFLNFQGGILAQAYLMICLHTVL